MQMITGYEINFPFAHNTDFFPYTREITLMRKMLLVVKTNKICKQNAQKMSGS